MCNIFFVSKLTYVLQVLHCARVNVQRFHRIFATFVWRSSWEQMRRDNLFLSLRAGGLGLVHLFVHQLVSRFLFFKNITHPFLLTVTQHRLWTQMPTVIVSSADFPPCRPRGFLKEVVDAFSFLQARFTLEYLFSCSRKSLSKALVTSLFPTPLYRTYAFCTSPTSDVLKRVRTMCVSPGAKTFFFQAAHNYPSC